MCRRCITRCAYGRSVLMIITWRPLRTAITNRDALRQAIRYVFLLQSVKPGCDRPASCVEWRKTISVLAMFLLCSKFKPTYAWFPSRVRIQQRNASHRIAIIFRSTPAFRQQLERCCIFPQVPAAWPRDGGIAVRCVASRYAMMETKR